MGKAVLAPLREMDYTGDRGTWVERCPCTLSRRIRFTELHGGRAMRTVLRGLMVLALSFGAMVAWADDERAYTEGAVISVSYVKTEPGMFDEYLKYLAGPY